MSKDNLIFLITKSIIVLIATIHIFYSVFGMFKITVSTLVDVSSKAAQEITSIDTTEFETTSISAGPINKSIVKDKEDIKYKEDMTPKLFDTNW